VLIDSFFVTARMDLGATTVKICYDLCMA